MGLNIALQGAERTAIVKLCMTVRTASTIGNCGQSNPLYGLLERLGVLFGFRVWRGPGQAKA
jgi:hypothetical protein